MGSGPPSGDRSRAGSGTHHRDRPAERREPERGDARERRDPVRPRPRRVDDLTGVQLVAAREAHPPARAVATERHDPRRGADSPATSPQPAQVGGVQCGDVDVGGGLGQRRGADLSQGRAPQARLIGIDGYGGVRLTGSLGDHRGQRRLGVGIGRRPEHGPRREQRRCVPLGGQRREPRARCRDQRADRGDPVTRDPGGSRPRRRVRAEGGLGFQQHHGPARRQLVGDRGAGDAAADDGDVPDGRHPFTVNRSRRAPGRA
jgi:hypothetical protein